MDSSSSDQKSSHTVSSSDNNNASDLSSQKDSSRQAISPLAPLEYLQKQRRGSITDPSLHAAPQNHHTNNSSSNLPSVFRHVEPSASSSGSSSALHDPINKNSPPDPRPVSPYVFGDATAHNTSSANHHSRDKSPSDSRNRDIRGSTGSGGQGSQEEQEQMSIDPKDSQGQSSTRQPAELAGSNREQHQFDYNLRRHSIAEPNHRLGQEPHSQSSGSHMPANSHGTKRKMSSDRGIFAPVDEEIDPQLVGPGVPSAMETDGPAPKRRGSAIDTQRIAQLSLYDRRNSVDSRGTGTGQWWVNERRDSSGSMFSNASSVGGYSSAFSADSPHGRPPPGMATFAWPPSTQPPDLASTPAMHNDADPNSHNVSGGPPRPFDPQIAMMHPITFAPDRRMSVPDNVPSNASTGPTRVLRSRSRPPSRQLRNSDPSNPNQSGQSSSSTATQEDPASAPSPGSSNLKPSTKETGATPYSRSPELRVSHKLAERKRRKEMKDLFDELRDQLPADRGMKASKWEILSKAIDFVVQLKQSHQDMAREIEMLRHEMDGARQGIPPFGGGPPPHPVVYGQGAVAPPQYPPPPPGAMPHPPPHPHGPESRPGSSQNIFPPGAAPSTAQPPQQNGNANAQMGRQEAPT